MHLLIEGFTAGSIDTGEVVIHYSEGPANGPPLLLLHGVTSRRDGFVRLIDPLVERFRVITIDQRGHGVSSHASGRYAATDHARDIRCVIDAVCGEPTIVWGHSMGGANAAETAALDGTRIRALVLEDPALFGPDRPPLAADSPVRRSFETFLRLVDAGMDLDAMASELAVLNPHQPQYFARWKAECLLQMDREILHRVALGRSPGCRDPRELTESIHCPVLLLQADPSLGGILSDDHLERIVPEREDFTVESLRGTGHNINREHPERLLPVVLPWLQTMRA